MKSFLPIYIALSILLSFVYGCDSGPKVIESASEATSENPVLDQIASTSDASVERNVVVSEVLHTEKYSYLNVKEDEQTYWIAIPKSEVEVGDKLIYRGGLMKKNFFSREYDRTFETLYLVSDIRKASADGSAIDQAAAQVSGGKSEVEAPKDIKPAKGAIRISDLIGHLSKYDGKVVRITGKCMKVNPMIMNRNWIHIQDGTANNHDLTFTTAENIPQGQIVTLEGTVALNKDFGAGYRYDVIIENAVVVD